jgi:hypothetical protein
MIVFTMGPREAPLSLAFSLARACSCSSALPLLSASAPCPLYNALKGAVEKDLLVYLNCSLSSCGEKSENTFVSLQALIAAKNEDDICNHLSLAEFSQVEGSNLLGFLDLLLVATDLALQLINQPLREVKIVSLPSKRILVIISTFFKSKTWPVFCPEVYASILSDMLSYLKST